MLHSVLRFSNTRYRASGTRSRCKTQQRTIGHKGVPQSEFEPLRDLHEWAEYVGEYKPVLLVQGLAPIAGEVQFHVGS